MPDCCQRVSPAVHEASPISISPQIYLYPVADFCNLINAVIVHCGLFTLQINKLENLFMCVLTFQSSSSLKCLFIPLPISLLGCTFLIDQQEFFVYSRCTILDTNSFTQQKFPLLLCCLLTIHGIVFKIQILSLYT